VGEKHICMDGCRVAQRRSTRCGDLIVFFLGERFLGLGGAVVIIG
jgi:hypothetical protein